MGEPRMAETDREPLYATVRKALVERLTRGEWQPGGLIPGETALAAEMGVSPGTMRKAIDGLVADGALRRHQGKGTYVAEQTPERASFHFFRLVDAEGNRAVPEPLEEVVVTSPAGPEVARRLGIANADRVVTVDRVRAVSGRPALLERVAVPAKMMPGLERETPLPNALYPHYQAAHGVTVASAEDRLSAITANAAAAKALGVEAGTPLLMAERVARDLSGRAVEWRRSRFLTDGLAYSVMLR